MMHLAEAAAALGAQCTADVYFDSVHTDSRTLAAGALFVALSGDNFNGHDFLVAARQAGAVAAMVDAAWYHNKKKPRPDDLPLLIVENSRQALGALAQHWRSRFTLPLVAVTGSNGKTTVKEMCAAILRQHFDAPAGNAEQVLATCGNLNNDIGLPLTLLRLRPQHKVAVVEMGMSHRGEIARLAAIAQPTIGVITNAHRAHLQGLGSVTQVAEEKGDLLKALPADGHAIWNADDAHAALWQEIAAAQQHTCSFGLQTLTATLRAERRQNAATFCLQTPTTTAAINLQLPGKHNILNALAAIAASLAGGAELADAQQALQHFRAVAGRLHSTRLDNGALLWDDSYNANPDSTRAAIDVLCDTPRSRKILVLGDMLEVGSGGAQIHDEIGGYAKSQGVDILLATGSLAAVAAHNFGAGGRHFSSGKALAQALLKEVDADTAVLVKGSRSMRMEKIIEQLLASLPADSGPEACHAL